MQTKQIVQSSANVIRITKLVKGDIYKRFEQNSDDTYFGIVTDVLNDGINTIITATEYRKSWSSINVSNKVIRGTQDFILFPATPDDLDVEFQSVIDSKEKEIEQWQKNINDAKHLIVQTEQLLNGELQKRLTVPEFKQFTQEEYNAKIEALN